MFLGAGLGPVAGYPLEAAPFLMGDTFTATDLLLVSPFIWFPKAAPDHPAITAWIARCEARPSAQRTAVIDEKHLKEQEAA